MLKEGMVKISRQEHGTFGFIQILAPAFEWACKSNVSYKLPAWFEELDDVDPRAFWRETAKRGPFIEKYCYGIGGLKFVEAMIRERVASDDWATLWSWFRHAHAGGQSAVKDALEELSNIRV